MRKLYAFAALMVGVAGSSLAANNDKENFSAPDSVMVAEMQEVVVKAVTVQKNAPFAVTKIQKEEVESFARTGQELPHLFARTPGVMAWSENGLGTGTTYMRIRGAADSRINVTLDGVALNSPEDQCVFWANMNSYASFLQGVQIQRGVGTSTNGDGAFGGSIALTTKAPSYNANGEVSAGVGSYGTSHAGGQFSTGLTGIHVKNGYLVIDGAYHNTYTDGYVHGTHGNSGSYYGALTYINGKGNFKMSYKNIGNYEKTGQAWNGVQTGDNDASFVLGSDLNWDNWPATVNEVGVKTYRDLYKAGLGRFNNLYERLLYQYGQNSFADENGNYATERYMMTDGNLWPRTIDKFRQNHNLLNFVWKINDHWNSTATLHYTRGTGYYEEFRYNNKLTKFGIAMSQDEKAALGIYMDKKGRGYADFVRQKGLTQNTYGLVWNTNYTNDKWDVIMGLSAQNFQGNHYGYLTYTSYQTLSDHLGIGNGKKYQYYDSDADKNDESVFLKANYKVCDIFSLYGDVQYRHVGFHTDGINDKFNSNKDGSEVYLQRLDINKNYHFVNPKVGMSLHKGGHNAYLSYALSHREPERNNFTDNGSYAAPKPESVHDIELGYGFTGKNWYASANLYYMRYFNQFVQTGELSDIGENLTTNIKHSYRMGVELSAGYSPVKWFTIEGNAALSQNKVLDFDEVMSIDWESDFQTIHYDNSTLAFSPSVMLNGFLDFHHKGFQAVWHTAYVSRQYMDNTENKLRSLPSFTTTAIHLSYDLAVKGKRAEANHKHLVFGVDLNNIFNYHYATSGWVYSSYITDAETGGPILDRYTSMGFIPAAGFNMMGSIKFKF